MKSGSTALPAGKKTGRRALIILGLGLILSQCRHQTRPALALSPHPYLPFQPGRVWSFEVTHWEYPSRFDASPLAFAMAEPFRVISLEPQKNEGWRILTEPPLTALFLPEVVKDEPARWVQDEQGIWLIWNQKPKKPTDRGLVLPAELTGGQTWSVVSPAGIILQFHLFAADDPLSAPPPAGERKGEESSENLDLLIEIQADGKTFSRTLRLARDLGLISLEVYSDSDTGPRLIERWQRTDLTPFDP